jgi:hypothetical protein
MIDIVPTVNSSHPTEQAVTARIQLKRAKAP